MKKDNRTMIVYDKYKITKAERIPYEIWEKWERHLTKGSPIP